MVVKSKPKSSVVRVSNAIREQIIEGKIPPGMRLVERRLRDEMKVSRPVVREALFRLAQLRLIEIIPGAGATVRLVSEAEVIDAYMFREAIEVAAAEQCTSRMNREEANQLLKIAALFQPEYINFSKGREHQLKRLEDEFHQGIIFGSRNDHFKQAWEIARLHLNLGSKSIPETIDSKVGRSSIVDEHMEIATAIQKGDTEGAGRLMKAHIRRGRDSYLDLLRMRDHKPVSVPR